MTLPKFYETKVIKTKEFPNNTILITLKLNEEFQFKAGQFVLVYKEVSGKEENRAFSIASPPSQNTIELLIKKYENGKLSPLLFELKENDKLKVRGPFGVFTLKPSQELVFIASGTGISPLRSMIHEALEANHNQSIRLFYGFRHEEDYFFKKDFENLQEKHKNFHVYPCSTKSDNANYLKGRVTKHVPSMVESKKEKNVYICGPNQMINDCLNILIKDLNFQREQVHIERWGTK